MIVTYVTSQKKIGGDEPPGTEFLPGGGSLRSRLISIYCRALVTVISVSVIVISSTT